MSASSMPTVRPRSRKPSARLTAVVDLPTPPLPEATAMIAPTPGTAWGARPGAPADAALTRQRGHRRGDARNGADRGLGGLAHRFPALHHGGIDRDREGHLAGLRQRRSVRARHRLERRQHRILGDSHCNYSIADAAGFSTAGRPFAPT